MLWRVRRSGLFVPTVLTVLGLAVLLSLGTWQLNRKVWKEELIAKLSARTVEAPISLSDARARWAKTGDVEYTHVKAVGRYDHGKERYLYAPHPKTGPGFHVYTPLQVTLQDVLWVNRGWIPDRIKPTAMRANGQPAGVVSITGLVRSPAAKGLFEPENDRSGNQWYWRDLDAMHASAFAGEAVEALPFFVEADANSSQGAKYPIGGVTRLKLPNRHLEYAITWFGLAIVLLAVFFVFAWGRLKQASG